MNKTPVVLVVDDEQTNIDVVSQILANRYDIRVAHNGEKALVAVEKLEIDLILLDLHMPEIDGFEVAQKIRSDAQYDNIPIIFLSSQSDEETIIKGFDLGGNDYITKPFNPKELLARVQTHLHVHQLQKFMEMMLNMQSTIIVLTDTKELQFINKTGLDFYGFHTLQEFQKHYSCICDTFLKMEGCYYQKKSDDVWINEILALPASQRNVAIQTKYDSVKVFNVSIQPLPIPSMYIVDFNDVTQTAHEQQKLQEKMMLDPLTNVYNRNYFDQNISTLTEHQRDSDKFKVIAFFDLDLFKNINDTYGHNVGDQVLQEFTQVLRDSSRTDDILIRWGGEEFVMILSINDQNSIGKILEKFRHAVEIHNFATIKRLTCSIGATFLSDKESVEDAIKRADQAMYKSKQNGRNRVTIL